MSETHWQPEEVNGTSEPTKAEQWWEKYVTTCYLPEVDRLDVALAAFAAGQAEGTDRVHDDLLATLEGFPADRNRESMEDYIKRLAAWAYNNAPKIRAAIAKAKGVTT